MLLQHLGDEYKLPTRNSEWPVSILASWAFYDLSAQHCFYIHPDIKFGIFTWKLQSSQSCAGAPRRKQRDMFTPPLQIP